MVLPPPWAPSVHAKGMEGVSWRCCAPAGDGTSWVNGGRDYYETIRAGSTAAPPGLSLVGYLAGRYRHSSEEEWAEHVRAGRVSLDGRRTTADDAAQPVRPGLRLCYHRPPWQEPLPHAPDALAVLYEDEDVLAVLKPSGLAVMPSELYWNHTVMAVLRRTYAGAESLPSPAHRLGVGTCGVLLCAKSAHAKRSLPAQFQAGTVGKEYRALASGVDTPDEFSCTQPIGLVEVRHCRVQTILTAAHTSDAASAVPWDSGGPVRGGRGREARDVPLPRAGEAAGAGGDADGRAD